MNLYGTRYFVIIVFLLSNLFYQNSLSEELLGRRKGVGIEESLIAKHMAFTEMAYRKMLIEEHGEGKHIEVGKFQFKVVMINGRLGVVSLLPVSVAGILFYISFHGHFTLLLSVDEFNMVTVFKKTPDKNTLQVAQKRFVAFAELTSLDKPK